MFQVKYMGAAAVGGRVASVRGLQEPLRQLLERIDRSVSAELEISRRGLTFRTSETNEKTNPFRRIAVWSALRLRSKVTPSGEVYHAFLPLVGDDQSPLGSEDKHADLYRVMRGLDGEAKDYPPMFAVVMRRPGAARLLECHAFACKVEEDAVAAAATLYRALLTDLDANRRRPRQTNGLGCVSLASVASSVAEPSIVGGGSVFGKAESLRPIAAAAPPGHPVRPPRVKKSSLSGSQSETTSVRSAKIDKAPRKKKISEIKAEDILEARSRLPPSVNCRPVVLKELRDKNPGKNCDTCNKSRHVRSRNEERNNLRNRIVLQENKRVPSGDGADSRMVYDENDAYAARRVYNDYEKLPKMSKSLDYNDKPDVDYSLLKKPGSYCYEGGARTEVVVETRPSNVERTQPQIGTTRSRANSIYGSNEQHLRDADKIYSLGQEDLSISGKRRTGRSTDSLNTLDRTGKLSDKIGGRDDNPYESRRPSRINTMDKPARMQLQNGLQGVGEYSESAKVRKRSRAGSEPPFSRTEDAIENSQDTKLKRSQSELEVDRGDPMTRVELPRRRGSFLKSANTRLPNCVNGGTPLGFTELFDEFRNQEGLTSVDDILDAIIGEYFFSPQNIGRNTKLMATCLQIPKECRSTTLSLSTRSSC